jgi:rhodanese-related sulfurtransferase
MKSRITPAEALERLVRGEPTVFVDARQPEAFATSSVEIPGSIRILADAVDGNADQVPRRAAVVAYCTCPREKSAAKVAQRLNELGFDETYALQGGFDAWVEAGYPVQTKGGFEAQPGA